MNDILEKITLSSLIESTIVALFTILFLRFLTKINKKYLTKHEDNSQMNGLVKVSFQVVKTIIIACAILMVLEINGINVTSLVAGLGLASAAVGLALQDFLKDSIMGAHIVSDHFFSVGDTVKYNDLVGVIENFNMKTTKIRILVDNSVLSICNRNISEITKLSDIAKVDIDLPLAYEEDFERVDVVLNTIIKKIGEMDNVQDAQYLGTDAFLDSAIVYKLRFYCPRSEMYDLRRLALRIIQIELRDNNMSIPYNKLDVHYEK